jgi:hypothetical protein
LIRRGIRAVGNGQSLDYRILQNGPVIPTYCHDRVILGVAPATTAQEDRQQLREFGRSVVEESVKAGLATA